MHKNDHILIYFEIERNVNVSAVKFSVEITLRSSVSVVNASEKKLILCLEAITYGFITSADKAGEIYHDS